MGREPLIWAESWCNWLEKNILNPLETLFFIKKALNGPQRPKTNNRTKSDVFFENQILTQNCLAKMSQQPMLLQESSVFLKNLGFVKKNSIFDLQNFRKNFRKKSYEKSYEKSYGKSYGNSDDNSHGNSNWNCHGSSHGIPHGNCHGVSHGKPHGEDILRYHLRACTNM